MGSKASGQQSKWGWLGVQYGVMLSQANRRFASHHFSEDSVFFDGKLLGQTDFSLIPRPTTTVYALALDHKRCGAIGGASMPVKIDAWHD